MINFSYKLTLLTVILILISACEQDTFRMTSISMEPTIPKGEIIKADLSAYQENSPQRWDIVLFQSPTDSNNRWGMRVVGLPGETINFDSLGITVNGERLNSATGINYELNPGSHHSPSTIQHPYTVPPNEYYLLGDNTEEAYDSRYWGGISRDKILGKILIK